MIYSSHSVFVTPTLIEMVPVEGGTFLMGDEYNNINRACRPVHAVTLKNFEISKFVITRGIWDIIMGGDHLSPTSLILPKTHLERSEILDFLERLNKICPDKNYRLPTEAEWEYAARGGKVGKDDCFKYAGSDDIDKVAWYNENSNGRVHPVGGKRPNQLGIYDMSGNVCELCSDRWSHGYEVPDEPKAHESSSLQYYICRGGSSGSRARFSRVAHRGSKNAAIKYHDLGFRVARDL